MNSGLAEALDGMGVDGLAKTETGKLILVEAKAHIAEGVPSGCKAGPTSLAKIRAALAVSKVAFGASPDASWETPFYQYANRLAHLYFAHGINDLDAYLLFIYFADAPDALTPCTLGQWQEAIQVTEKSLGLGAHRFKNRIRSLIWSVPDMLASNCVT